MTIMTCSTSSRVSVSASSRHAARGDGWIIVSDFWNNNSRYNGYREKDEVSNTFLRQQPDMPTRINNISKQTDVRFILNPSFPFIYLYQWTSDSAVVALVVILVSLRLAALCHFNF